MVSLGIVLIWSIFLIIEAFYHKEIGRLLFLILFIIPTIPVGESRYNALYYWIAFLFLFILIKNYQIKISRTVAFYVLSLLVLMIIYTIAWGINGKGGLLGVMIGYFKFIPIILEFAIILRSYSTELIEKWFASSVDVTLIINFIVVIGQMINPEWITKLVEIVMFNDDTINASDQIANGVMSRCYGIFNHPAALAIFALIAVSVYISKVNDRKINYIYLMLSIFVGIAAMSKTFILGLPIILAFYYLQNYRKVNNIRWFIFLLVSICMILLLIINLKAIIQTVASYNSVLGYYLSMLEKPINAFTTRYGKETGALRQNYPIIMEHYLIGVGPNQIRNESIVDSAPITILHNGGIIALSVVLITYARLFFNAWHEKSQVVMRLLIVIFLSGFALPSWVFHSSTLCCVTYSLVILSKQEKLNKRINPRLSEKIFNKGVLRI